MLVLSRRVGEEVVLPGVLVRLVVLAVAGGRVRVGVVAPPDVSVLRGELCSDRRPRPDRMFNPSEDSDEPA